jgi:hypothetical protein
VTLASMGVVAGLARTVTDLRSVAVDDERFIDIFGSGDVGPVPALRSGRSAPWRSASSSSATSASARTWSRSATTSRRLG